MCVLSMSSPPFRGSCSLVFLCDVNQGSERRFARHGELVLTSGPLSDVSFACRFQVQVVRRERRGGSVDFGPKRGEKESCSATSAS